MASERRNKECPIGTVERRIDPDGSQNLTLRERVATNTSTSPMA